MASVILSIAPELIDIISNKLDISSLKELRLSCKHLGQAIGPKIHRSITINVARATVEKDVNKLRTLALQTSTVSKWAKELTIYGLSPSFDPSHDFLLHYVDGDIVQIPAPEVTTNVLQAVEDIPAYLLKALKSFVNVRSVKWLPISADNKSVQNMVYEAIKTLPNLRTLDIHISNIKIPLQLEEINRLQSISIRGDPSDELEDILLDNFAKMTMNSPELMSINLFLDSRYGKTPPITHSLYQVFKYHPDNAPPLRLHHLGINACLVRLDHKYLRHFQLLRSLKLTGVVDPCVPLRRNQEEIDLTEHKRISSSPNDFWKVLIGTGIQLEEIEHGDISPSFLEYLTSYSGLKRLILTPDGVFNAKTGTPLKDLAPLFFNILLLNHSKTLEELQISPSYEGAWCLTPENSSIISACRNLKKLHVCVNSAHLVDLQDNIINLFINTASMQLEYLEKLGIFVARSEGLRGARCGNAAIFHFDRASKRLTEVVEAYKAPASCTVGLS